MTHGIPFHIVLVEPEIPPNTGNIARLCGATGTVLHLVGKLGFSTDDRALKRAGLDYWHSVQVHYWPNLEALREAFPDGRFVYTSKKAALAHSSFGFRPGDFIVFGKETAGLPDELIAANPETSIRI
ncbi:MAG TPA: tRNA (cytidine(34)-2'-O)-methyltransferase, partial [Geobacteraceae bacterium]